MFQTQTDAILDYNEYVYTVGMYRMHNVYKYINIFMILKDLKAIKPLSSVRSLSCFSLSLNNFVYSKYI